MTGKERALAKRRRFIAKQRELGLCIECVHPVKEGCIRCPACLERRNAKRYEYKRQAAQAAMCLNCYKEPAYQSSKLCLPCFAKKLSRKHFGTQEYWQALIAKFNAQEGRCAYSDRELTLTDNTELDHILPKTRGGTNTLDNVQWVLAAVNRMKHNMTEDEFFALITDIYNRRPK